MTVLALPDLPATVIETPRLRLLPLTREMLEKRLAAETFSLDTHGQTLHFAADWPGDPLDAFGLLLAQLDALGRDVLAGSYAAAERESGAVVGMLGTKGGISAGGEIEIGYGFGPAYRGQGYATEAVHALTVHLLAQPRIRTVTAQTALGNRASERVLQKVGFARMDRRWDVGGEVLTLWAVES